MEKTYTIVREQNNGEKIYIDYTKFNGYKVRPRNNVKYEGVKVNSLVILKPSFIEKLLKKKVKRKLDFYLQYIISLMDNNEEDGNVGNLKLALDDLARYKSIVEYKYRKYLDQKYINLLLKKIDILEHEIKMKLIYKQEEVYEMEETIGKSR
ncbi:MAG: hypothetical protein E7157_04450 [Lactobacillales bacterium]|nr:hypothetical protein [Lactobacillales bacterium]